MQRIGVGSRNHVKVSAVEEVIPQYPGLFASPVQSAGDTTRQLDFVKVEVFEVPSGSR